MKISSYLDNYEIISISMEYARKCHEETNHSYDGQPYTVHLKMTYDCGVQFKHLLPSINDEIVALSACSTHDVIEDCRQSYNNVKDVCGESVADIVYALTNEKGKNRKERANDKYYEGIRNTPNAIFVKLCDRIANVRYSKEKGSRMFELYKKEHKHFCDQLYDDKLKPMFDELSNLIN